MAFLTAFAQTRGFLLGHPGRFQLTPDGDHVLFLRAGARSPELALFTFDVQNRTERELIAPVQLVQGEETLSDAERARRERQRITDRGFTVFELSPDGQQVLLPFAGKLYLVNRVTGEPRVLVDGEGHPLIDARFSPDGRRVGFVRSYDLWVVDIHGEGHAPAARPLTTDGREDAPNGLAEFVAQEEMGRHSGWWWSPDGRAMAFAAVDESQVERFSIADPAHPERPPQIFRYPRPGRANAQVRLGIVAADQTQAPAPRWVEWDRAAFPYLARVCWHTERAPLCVLVQTRDQREQAFLAVHDSTGATRVLHVDRDPAWVNLDRTVPLWLPDGSGFLRAHETESDRTLVLHAATGEPARVIVDGGFRDVVHVDGVGRSVVVVQGDAVSSQIVRVGLDGAPAVTLLDEAGDHDPVFARNGTTFVDSHVAKDAWPTARVHGRGAPVVLPSVAETPPFSVNLELCTVDATPEGESSPLTFHAAVVRPHDWRPGTRLPVIVHVYGGPHAQVVKPDQRHYLFDQWLANHGCVVVAIDNRGTPRRGRRWERAIKGDLGTIALRDQVAALHALAHRFPELDLARVGIYGWSFGGFMAARAVLARPDVFHCAVAGAPVVDWQGYDTHYTERYLDVPPANAAGYEASSLLPLAGRAPDAVNAVARPLLIVHGTADDNVYVFHSLQLADALLRSGRNFSFLPLPGVTHQIGDPVVREQVWARTADFLFQHLFAT